MYSQAHTLTLMQKNDKDPNLKLVTIARMSKYKSIFTLQVFVIKKVKNTVT